MRSEISFDHHSFQNDPGMTVFCHSDLILSFETKDERNEVDKVPTRELILFTQFVTFFGEILLRGKIWSPSCQRKNLLYESRERERGSCSFLETKFDFNLEVGLGNCTYM